jgi:hypothetical protein
MLGTQPYHTASLGDAGNQGLFVPSDAGGPQIEAARDVWRGLKQVFELCQATEQHLL